MRHNPPSPSRLTRYFILNVIKFTSDSRKGKPEKMRTRMKWNLRLPKSIIERKTFFYSLSLLLHYCTRILFFIFFMLIQLLLAVKGMSLFGVGCEYVLARFFRIALCIRSASYYFILILFIYVNVCILDASLIISIMHKWDNKHRNRGSRSFWVLLGK